MLDALGVPWSHVWDYPFYFTKQMKLSGSRLAQKLLTAVPLVLLTLPFIYFRKIAAPKL